MGEQLGYTVLNLNGINLITSQLRPIMMVKSEVNRNQTYQEKLNGFSQWF